MKQLTRPSPLSRRQLRHRPAFPIHNSPTIIMYPNMDLKDFRRFPMTFCYWLPVLSPPLAKGARILLAPGHSRLPLWLWENTFSFLSFSLCRLDFPAPKIHCLSSPVSPTPILYYSMPALGKEILFLHFQPLVGPREFVSFSGKEAWNKKIF